MLNERNYKGILVIVIILFLISFFTMRISDIFRLHKDLNWVYKYSHVFYLFIIFPLTTFFIIINPFIILLNKKLSNKIIWITIGLIPLFTYLIIPYFNDDLNNLNHIILKKYFSDCRLCFLN